MYGFNKVDYLRKDLNTFQQKISNFPAGQNPVEGNVLKRMLPGKADEYKQMKSQK